MIKVKLYELEKHRNETTFRPFLFTKDLFREIGIEFVSDGKADFAFVAQASIIDKKISLKNSINYGLNFLSQVKEPYFLFDGQDSTSLIGTYEVFKESRAIYLLKNNLLKDRTLYKNKYINGRYFWGNGNYSCEDFDTYNSKILLSGFNWLNTYGYNLIQIPFNKDKLYDVCCLIGIGKENYEHELRTDVYYNQSRYQLFDQVKNLKCNVITTEKTGKLEKQQYFNVLANSKICISPYGYGEIAIRDIEAILSGCIVIKPDMSFVDTTPNIYNKETCIFCKADYSDLCEKIDYILVNYNSLAEMHYSNIKKTIVEEFDGNSLILKYYNIFKNLNGITVE
jgi:hypothetical protein